MANGGLEEGLGGVQWELVGCLGLAWLMVYLIVWKGLHQSGKVDKRQMSSCDNMFYIRSSGSLPSHPMSSWLCY